jgi:Zn finger protein HypA/HybF involved in hydrogenase expression
MGSRKCVKSLLRILRPSLLAGGIYESPETNNQRLSRPLNVPLPIYQSPSEITLATVTNFPRQPISRVQSRLVDRLNGLGQESNAVRVGSLSINNLSDLTFEIQQADRFHHSTPSGFDLSIDATSTASVPSANWARNVNDAEKQRQFLDFNNWVHTRDLIRQCTSNMCYANFTLKNERIPIVTFECIEAIRLELSRMSKVERKQVAMDMLRNNVQMKHFTLSLEDVRGKDLCRACVKSCLSMPESTFTKLVKSVMVDGIVTA